MLQAGDELGRTQAGNNNAYCQDNEISWLDWENSDPDLMIFTGSLLAFRRAHPAFRRHRWFQDRPLHGQDIRDVVWFTPAGKEMSEHDWSVGFAKSLMVFLNGQAIPSRGQRGEAIVDDSFLLCFNAHYESVLFTAPDFAFGRKWRRVIDTADSYLTQPLADIDAGDGITLENRSMMVLLLVE